ncbi:MAG: effector binding domain-containing protein [Eubacteriales bacterium]
MEWVKNLNQAITYIEDNLENVIEYNELAKIACCSSCQFQRVFSYISGVTLAEYIRRRRMTKAASELQNSNIKIIDLSIKYGYNSPTSFSRAFQSVHDVPPSYARRKGVVLKSYPKLMISFALKGDVEMEYRIVEKPEFRIIGFKKKLEFDIGKNFITVPLFWEDLKKKNLLPQLCELMNQTPSGVLGITFYQRSTELNYYVAVASDNPVPNGMVEYVIPQATYAVFKCTGEFPEAIRELYRRFYSEWLPFSGYEYAEMQDIEVYPLSEKSANTVEVWFAIKE